MYMLPVALYCCELWSLALKVELRLRVFEIEGNEASILAKAG